MAERRAPARAKVATSVVVLLLAGLLPAPTALAADPIADARQELSRRLGGSPDDFQLLEDIEVTAEPGMWAGKFLDLRSGAVLSSYRRADGTTGSVELLDEALAAAQAALPVLERKADASLVAAVRVRRAGPGPACRDLARRGRVRRRSRRGAGAPGGRVAGRSPDPHEPRAGPCVAGRALGGASCGVRRGGGGDRGPGRRRSAARSHMPARRRRSSSSTCRATAWPRWPSGRRS